MLKLDRKYFESMSEKTKFQKDILEKVFRLADIFRAVYEDGYLKSVLVLKGGTAINFIYFNMPRLSVDIDFNFVSDKAREDMLESRKAIDKILTKIFNAKGYEIEKVQPYALLQYNLKYTNTAANIDRIKVEINFMERIPVFQVIVKEANVFDNRFEVSTYRLEELFATKLRALLTRAASRDLFDIYNLIESDTKFDEKMLKKCFIFYIICADDFRKLGIKIIEGVNHNEIKKFLLPLLVKGSKMKMNVKIVKDFVSKMLLLNDSEQEFIRLFYEQKKVDLDLLFENIEYNPKLRAHPMLEWKLKNMQIN